MRESEGIGRRESQNVLDEREKKEKKKQQTWCNDYLLLLDWFPVTSLMYTLPLPVCTLNKCYWSNSRGGSGTFISNRQPGRSSSCRRIMCVKRMRRKSWLSVHRPRLQYNGRLLHGSSPRMQSAARSFQFSALDYKSARLSLSLREPWKSGSANASILPPLM